MNNNIFIKLNKNKYNPDIESKLDNITSERTQTKFNLSKTIYNPITGIIPDKLNSQNDLVLQKDNNNIDFKSLILNKETERTQQNELYKPQKIKVINTIQNSNNTNNLVINTNSNSNTNNNNNTNSNNNCEYIKTYNELKHGIIINNKSNSNQNNYDNILLGLKDLGIIK